MKRKTPALILGMMISTVLLTGCAETPEDSLVKMKGKEAAEKNYEEAAEIPEGQAGAEGTENTDKTTIRDIVGAPETYQSTVTDETGKLTIVPMQWWRFLRQKRLRHCSQPASF